MSFTFLDGCNAKGVTTNILTIHKTTIMIAPHTHKKSMITLQRQVQTTFIKNNNSSLSNITDHIS